MASDSARRAPTTMAGQAAGLSRSSSGGNPGFVTDVSHASATSRAPAARRIVEAWWIRMARSSSEGHAEVDGDDRGWRDMLGDVAVLRAEGVPAHHLRIEQPQLVIDPLQVVLRRDAERRRAGPADRPAHRDRDRHVAQLPEVLREPEGIYVRVPRDALLALAGGELDDVRHRVDGAAAAGVEEGIRARARRPAHGAAQGVEGRAVLDPRAALVLATRRHEI